MVSTPAQQSDGARVRLAFVSVSVRPYRVDLLRRIATELHEVELYSLFDRTWDAFRWADPPPAVIKPVHFGGPSLDGSAMGRLRDFFGDWRRGGAIVDYLVENEIDVVVLNGWGSASFLRVIRDCGRRSIPLFMRADSNIYGDLLESRLRVALRRRLLKWVLRRVSGVMPMSAFGEAFFLRYGASPDRFYWVPCEPDFSRFESVEEHEVMRLLEAKNLAVGRRRFLVSGLLVRRKRVDLALRAFIQVAAANPSWDLVIAGDGPLRNELEQLVPPELRSRVAFLGFCSPSDMRVLYKSCDVLVHPTENDPFPLVVLEAMGAGLPIIASNVAGTASEAVLDSVNGRIFNSGDHRELATCMADLCEVGALDRYRSQVAPALDQWRRRCDPVMGLRRALASLELIDV